MTTEPRLSAFADLDAKIDHLRRRVRPDVAIVDTSAPLPGAALQNFRGRVKIFFPDCRPGQDLIEGASRLAKSIGP